MMLSESVLENSPVASPKGSWMAWAVCLSAGLFFFYEFFQLNLFDVINDPLREAFQIDATQISWMSSMYLWANLLFLLPAGFILDKLSIRLVILNALFVCIIGTVGFALTSSFAIGSFFHFLSGIGNAFCFLSCVVLVSRWFPPRRQAFVIGCVVTMAFFGGLMAHTPLAYLTEQYGWRYALLIDGGIGILIFFWILLIVRDHPPGHQPEQDAFKSKPRLLSVLKNPQNWLAGIYTACLNLPIMVLCALWGATYLDVVYQLPKLAASNVVSLILMGSIVGCPLVGWLSDRLGHRKPLMILGACLSLLVVIPLFMEWSLSERSLGVLFFLLGLLTSTQVIAYPLISESNPIDNTGLATGIASLIIMGGAGVGQVFFGLLMGYHGSTMHYVPSDFQFALWMFPITIVVALVAVLLTRETHCKRFN